MTCCPSLDRIGNRQRIQIFDDDDDDDDGYSTSALYGTEAIATLDLSPFIELIMYFPRILASIALLAASAHGFVQPSGFGMTRSSSLKMVADDAKVVLITGSSRGLGKAIALDIGAQGQKVIINYVSDGSKESAEGVVAEIKELGGDAVAIQADSEYEKVVD